MTLKHKLNGSNQAVLGTMVSELRNPNSAVMLSTAGLDFFIIDMEHGTFDYSDMAALVTAARGKGIDPAVRIPEIRRESVLKPLDAGATTLIVPQVEEVEEAEKVLRYALYPDRGHRGVALRRAHSNYAANPAREYMSGADQDIFVLLQIETVRGLNNIDRLAQVEGVGGFFIGPFDLSVDMGKPAEINDPELRDAYRRVLATTRKHDLAAAIQLFDPLMAGELIDEGISICSIGSDVNTLVDHTADLVRRTRGAVGGSQTG